MDPGIVLIWKTCGLLIWVLVLLMVVIAFKI